jgi:hypothetical protein
MYLKRCLCAAAAAIDMTRHGCKLLQLKSQIQRGFEGGLFVLGLGSHFQIAVPFLRRIFVEQSKPNIGSNFLARLPNSTHTPTTRL